MVALQCQQNNADIFFLILYYYSAGGSTSVGGGMCYTECSLVIITYFDMLNFTSNTHFTAKKFKL